MANTNKGFINAAKAKKDEFYTQLTDIEKEMCHYKNEFKDKVIFLNCDDPDYSNFWKYFHLNFYALEIKKLISTHYEIEKQSYKLEIIASDIEKNGQLTIPQYVKTDLKQNGDFRSPECIEILKEADLIITNPPFSLFREYIAQLFEYNKKFIIIGNQNALTYKEIFPLVRDNKMWYGISIHSHGRDFRVPDDYPLKAYEYRTDDKGNKYINIKGVRWFTNIDYKERHEDLILYKEYSEDEYKKYDDYDAIEVSKTAEIPLNYYGKMGVPISFMDKYNPDQFEILGLDRYVEDNPHYGRRFKINGKETYARIIIRRKQNENRTT